ncbi:MAG: DUF2997 domain-containing protein [Deltaproteobacteria bacterium]|nr:MAG: DUF2997 domain-containing protein [Deltaproteobacteria bacterium]
MASSVEISFKIAPDGEVTFEIAGITGRGCEELVKLLAELGKKIEEKNTAAYYQTLPDPTVSTRQHK